MEMRIAYSVFTDSYDFIIAERDFSVDGGIRYGFVAQPLTMEKVEIASAVKPTGQLSRAAVQGLFDQIWQDGFRPKDGEGSGGHVAALKYHLEDMRSLVFKPVPTQGEKK